MSDVLSQSQIESLLRVVQKDARNSNDDDERRVRKYDFHTPKKFTKDRLKLISGVYENYARLIASHLTSLLRMDIEVKLLAVEEQRYYEFNNSLGDEDILAFMNADFPNETGAEEIVDPVFFQLSMSIIHGIVDRMLGGSGDEDPTTENDAITEVEMALYENMLEKIAPIMDSVWEVYVNSEFSFMRIETNPRLVQAIGMDEIVAIVAFSIRINSLYGQLNVCIPASILEFIFKKIEESANFLNRKKELQTEEERESLFHRIEEADLELYAHMDYFYLHLNDVFRMREGDIINLTIPKESEVCLDVGGNPWFKGKMGIFRGKKAVKISRVLEHEDILSLNADLYYELLDLPREEVSPVEDTFADDMEERQ